MRTTRLANLSVLLALALTSCTTHKAVPHRQAPGKSALAPPAGPTDPRTTLRVHFIDVGQADAVLLEFPCAAMLVDLGAEVNRPPA